MSASDGAVWRCARCDEALVMMKTVFHYLGQSFTHEVPRCPKCGRVLIPPELARGKMAEVEEQLEDK
jgi:NAD-dependent SIR2 family protein deacetylase